MGGGCVTKKLIRLKDGIKEMDCEEVYLQFQKYLYKIAAQYSQYEFDDAFQVACIGLLKAYNSYDESKEIMFMTYLASIVQNELNMYHRKNNRHSNTASLDEPLTIDADGNELNLSEVLASNVNVEDEVIDSIDFEILEDMIDSLPERERVVTRSVIMDDETQRNVADSLGLSQSYISRLAKKIPQKLKKQYEKGGFEMEKITREQLLAECRTHGTGKKACEIIADKYGMTPGSVSVKLTKQGICKQLKEERKQSEVTVITQGNENEVKIQQPETKVFEEKESELEIKSIPEIKETEPVISPIKWHEDKKRISTLTAKAWDGKENSYIFRDGRLVISNSEGTLAVADLKTLILELQELAESQEAV